MRSRRFGIVVGVDGSPASSVAVRFAARDAELRQLPLTVVHAVPDGRAAWAILMLARVLGQPPLGQAHRVLDHALAVVDESCRAGGPPKVIAKLALADPVATLAELSEDAELLVVGSRDAGALRLAVTGSVSAALVSRSRCAIAVVHDEDPLMPHPLEAPVLVGVDGPAGSRSAVRLARQEATRRGVSLIEVPVSTPMSRAAADRLVEQSESAQLVVLGDRAGGAAVARSARMPVIVT